MGRCLAIILPAVFVSFLIENSISLPIYGLLNPVQTIVDPINNSTTKMWVDVTKLTDTEFINTYHEEFKDVDKVHTLKAEKQEEKDVKEEEEADDVDDDNRYKAETSIAPIEFSVKSD
ncbi:uncharacterized protein LOC127281582 isoform X1 [Leptopilina boulardi]|uniref:uncharacterized protein LOC127281582 isoform X1 n=1 Tax=Leptopilina boulardi TaxID=63433 RepID=UPI0021F6438E|nr:uncharacterized protein LOC127281582 isoform X1 [Leptopilina boulardi]